jgi:hypothetical protein
VKTLLHRAEEHFTLNVEKAREVEFVKKILVWNKYPEHLVENIANKRKNINVKKGKLNQMGHLLSLT